MNAISRTLIPLCLFALLKAAVASIQFSPNLTDFTAEGVVYQRLTFKDDKRTVTYLPPKGWDCSGGGDHLRLNPPKKSLAEAEISAIPLEKPQPLTDESAPALVNQVLAALPPGNQQATIVKQEINPIPFNNNPTFEVIVSYKALGDTFQKSVLFVNTPTNQIIF